MKRTRISCLALLLALALTAGLLAGCSGSDTEATATPAPATAAPTEHAATEVPETQAPSQETEPAAAGAITYPLAGEDLELQIWTTFVTNAGTYVNSYNDWPAIALAEEVTGVHIEWIENDPGSAGEIFSVSVASGDYPDMYRNFANYYSGSQAYDEGVILRLNNLAAEYAPAYQEILTDEDCHKAAIDDDGNMWFIYSFITEYRPNGGLTIRQDMLEELGAEVPTTLDEFTDLMAAAQTEFNLGNTLFIHSGNYLGALTNLAHAFGVPGVSTMTNTEPFYQIDGTVHFGTIDDGYRDYLTQMREWYTMGLISPDFITASGNDKGDEAVNAIANDAFAANTILELWSNYAAISEDADFALMGIANLTADGTNVTHFTNQSRLGNSNIAITTGCEIPEIAMQWLNWWFTEEGKNVANYGEEGVTFTLDASGNPQFTDFVLNGEMDGLNATQIANYYCLYNNVVGLMDEWRLLQFYSDAEIQALETWIDSTDFDWGMPKSISLTTEESSTASTILADIQTYTEESVARFITGEMDIEADWETFVSTIESLGVQTCIDIYQAAYDRYTQR